MMYIGDLLNKIRWDKTADPKEYTLVYFDRIQRETYEVNFTEIGRDGAFFIVKRDGQKTSIPVHRIKQVKRKGKVIWARE